jgi:hypothetical protein
VDNFSHCGIVVYSSFSSSATGCMSPQRFTSHSNDAWRQDFSFQYVEAIVGYSMKLGAQAIVWWALFDIYIYWGILSTP